MRNSHLSIVPPKKSGESVRDSTSGRAPADQERSPGSFKCADPFGEWVKDICERMDEAITRFKEQK